MVPVKHDDCGLSPLLDGSHQIPGKLVHLVDLVHIVLPFILEGLVLDALHLDLRVLDDLLLRVISMSLDTDSEHKVLLLRGIHGFQDVIDEHLVLGPSVFRGLEDVHELLAGEGVKAHHIVHSGPAVEIASVVVKSVSPVAQSGKGGSRALRGLELYNRLVGILTRSEVPHVHARKHLELCVGRPGTHRGHLEIAG